MIVYEQNFNPFDEFGLLVGVKRLPGEANHYYKNRLLDASDHLAGANLEGLLNGISRDLSLKPYYDAVKIKAGTEDTIEDTYTPLIDDNPYLEITQTGLFYDSDNLKKTEDLTIEEITRHIILSEYPRFIEDIKIYINGEKLSNHLYEVNNKTIKIDNRVTATEFKVEYHYKKYIPFCLKWPNGWITINQLKTEVDNFTNTSGFPFINMTVTHGGSEPVYKLLRIPRFSLDRDGVNLNIYPITIWELFDELFLDLIENAYGHHYKTDLQGWANSISSKASITWDNCILDSDSWALTSIKNIGLLKHLYDNRPTRIFGDKEYSVGYYFAKGGFKNDVKLKWSGVNNNQYKSGISKGDNIKLIKIKET